MLERMRAVLTVSLAMFLLAAVASATSARNLSVSNQQIRTAFQEVTFGTGGLPGNVCDFTLEGSLHARTIPKVVNSLMGYITRVATANCTLTTAILRLPWHVRYVGFSGTLPDITLLIARISRISFSFGALGFVCLGEPEIEVNFRREAGGRLTGVNVVTNPEFPVRSGGGFGCPSEQAFIEGRNVGTITLLGNSNDISVTLI